MKLINFIIWLTTGAIVGWFASRIISAENRLTHKPVASKGQS